MALPTKHPDTPLQVETLKKHAQPKVKGHVLVQLLNKGNHQMLYIAFCLWGWG